MIGRYRSLKRISLAGYLFAAAWALFPRRAFHARFFPGLPEQRIAASVLDPWRPKIDIAIDSGRNLGHAALFRHDPCRQLTDA